MEDEVGKYLVLMFVCVRESVGCCKGRKCDG